jgi:hypothetical protein
MNNFTFLNIDVPTSDDLLIEIQYKNQRVCLLSKEKGTIQIELIDDLYLLEKKVDLKFCLTDFLTAIQYASDSLLRRA